MDYRKIISSLKQLSGCSSKQAGVDTEKDVEETKTESEDLRLADTLLGSESQE